MMCVAHNQDHSYRFIWQIVILFVLLGTLINIGCRKPLIQAAPNISTWMGLVSACSCLCAIYWSQVFSGELICSWGSADRRCSNYIWVISNGISCYSASYISDLTVTTFLMFASFYRKEHIPIMIADKDQDLGVGEGLPSNQRQNFIRDSDGTLPGRSGIAICLIV